MEVERGYGGEFSFVSVLIKRLTDDFIVVFRGHFLIIIFAICFTCYNRTMKNPKEDFWAIYTLPTHHALIFCGKKVITSACSSHSKMDRCKQL